MHGDYPLAIRVQLKPAQHGLAGQNAIAVNSCLEYQILVLMFVGIPVPHSDTENVLLDHLLGAVQA